MLEEGNVVDSFLKSKLSVLYKNKGSPQECTNYRGLMLSPVMAKVFIKMITFKIYEYVESIGLLPESQAGFRQNRSCTDMNFILNDIRNQCKKYGMDLYIAFIDFLKAYDSVHRNTLWRILKTIGIPDKLMKPVIYMYGNSVTRVLEINGTCSEYFSTSTGLRQGCPLSPLLFTIYSAYVRKIIVKGLEPKENGWL